MPNKYISQYTEKTDAISTDLFLIQRGSVYYKQKRSSLFAVLDGYIPLTGSSVITGDLKYTKGSDANFGTADNYGLNLITNNATRMSFDTTGLVLIGAQTFANTSPTSILSLGGQAGTVRGALANVKLRTQDIGGGIFLGIGAWSDGSNGSFEINLQSTVGDLRIYQGESSESFAFLSENAGGFFGTRLTRRVGVGNGVVDYKSLLNSSGAVVDYSSINTISTTDTAGSHVGDLVFFVASGGALTERLRVKGSGEVNINQFATINGTAGAGFVGIVAQSSNASAPAATGLKLFSASDGHFSWVVKNGGDTFVRKIGGTLTADRTYEAPNASGTLALQTGAFFARFSAYYYEIPYTTSTAAAGWVANKLYCFPFPLGNIDTISALRVEVTTPIAASTAEVGVYEDDGSGYPSTLLASGQVDCSSGGFKEVTGLTLTGLSVKRQVWLCVKPSIGTIGWRFSGNAIPLIPRTTGTAAGISYTYTGSAGALPATFAGGAALELPGAGAILIGAKM